jgi:hypothetical protein
VKQPPKYGIRVTVSHDPTRFGGEAAFHKELSKLGVYIQEKKPHEVQGLIEPDRLETLATTEGLRVRVDEPFQLDPKEWAEEPASEVKSGPSRKRAVPPRRRATQPKGSDIDEDEDEDEEEEDSKR